MNYEDIEKKLKSDLDKKEQKDFSIRWAEIQDRIKITDKQYEKNTAPVLSMVGVTTTDSACSSNKKPLVIRITLIILAAVFALVLAIVLPIVLTKNDDKIYYNEEQLHFNQVKKEEFYSGLNESNIKIVDLSEYEVGNYRLYYLDDNSIKGGGFEFFNNSLGYYAVVVFYDSTVKVNESNSDFNICTVKGAQIKYTLEQMEGYCVIEATTVFEGIYYRLICNTTDEDVYGIFNQFLK